MKMDRSENADGGGKYAIINLRKLKQVKQDLNDGGHLRDTMSIDAAMRLLTRAGVLNFGNKGSKDEFFPIYLKDTNSYAALRAYSVNARLTDPEWADEVAEMLSRAGPNHPDCKIPD
jgi:hypothetical protein